MNDTTEHNPDNNREGFPRPGRSVQAGGSRPAAASDLLAGDLGWDDAVPPTAGIQLMDYWRVVLNQRWVILAVASVVVVFTFFATLLVAPTYRATVSLQIDREALKVVDFEGDQHQVENGSSTEFYQTQYELLKSRALAQRVSDKLGLPQDPRYAKLFAPTVVDRLLDRDALPQSPKTEQDIQRAQATAVQAIGAGLTVEPVRNSRLVRLHFDSPDPQFSATVANTFADAFIASTLERRFDASSYAKKFLEERLQQLKLRLEASERQLVQFAQKEQIVNGEEGGSLAGSNLTELSTTLAQVKAQRIRAEARWRQASSNSGAGLPADMLEGSIIRQLQGKRAELLAEYQENLSTYKPDYPLMQQIQGQIHELDRQINQELVGIRASVKAEYDAALGQERLMDRTLEAVRAGVLDLQNRSIDYTILKREVDTNRQIYDALLQRYKEIGVAGGVSTNNVSIVDRAQPSGNRFKPNMSQNLALALLVGLMAGLIVAFLREHLDDTIRGPEDLEKLLGLAVLGNVPLLLRDQSPLQATNDPRSAFAEAYRSVRTALQFSTDSGVPSVLLITSAAPGEGKSTTALVLARNLAQLGKRVLLIDADLRNPSLHRVLQIGNERGLSNYLAGATELLDANGDAGCDNLWVIPSGPLPPNPAELLAGPKMKRMLALATEQYDHVILDGPPILGLADAMLLSHAANGTLLMVAAGKTRRHLLKSAYKRLTAARSRVIGAVVTMYDAKRMGYGDYGYYSYGAEQAKQRR